MYALTNLKDRFKAWQEKRFRRFPEIVVWDYYTMKSKHV